MPALYAAIERRAEQLNAHCPDRQSTPASAARWERSVQAHREIEANAAAMSRCFENIHRADEASPVRLGRGVDGVLDAFLEEILVRIHASS